MIRWQKPPKEQGGAAHQAQLKYTLERSPSGKETKWAAVTQVQAICLVIRAHRTARKAIQRAAEVLQRADAPVLGVILNGLAASSSDYYNDYYHYDEYRAKPPAKS